MAHKVTRWTQIDPAEKKLTKCPRFPFVQIRKAGREEGPVALQRSTRQDCSFSPLQQKTVIFEGPAVVDNIQLNQETSGSCPGNFPLRDRS